MSWKTVAALLTFSLFAIGSHGQQLKSAPSTPAQLPAPEPASRPVIGLALEGGGALGLAHIGVLEWLEEHHIPVDRLAGTSMGALVGGLYASGMPMKDLNGIGTSDSFKDVFTLQSPYNDLSFRRRQDRFEAPQSLTVGLRHGARLQNGLLAERGVNELLATIMANYNSRELDFNTMPIPFRCVATDLTSLKAITFSRGPLPSAVRASISIPGVFPPVTGSDGHFLVDGGIMDNLPVDVVRRELKADVVIAIHLKNDVIRPEDTASIIGVLDRAFTAGIELNVSQAIPLADILITVPLDDYSGTDYAKSKELIQAGYDAAEQNRIALVKYALKDQDWNAYLAARNVRIHPQPGTLQQVLVNGGSPAATQTVLADFKPLQNKSITPGSTITALKSVQSNGGLSAAYETFMPAASGANTLGSPSASGDTGILVRLSKDSIGPPYLLIGPEIAASTSNVSRILFNLRIVDQNLGGYGSEARVRTEIGYRTSLGLEYYRLLTPSGYFIEPHTGILRQPVYIWQDQKRIAERFQQNLSASIEAGRTFSNTVQVSAEWGALDTRWAPRTGLPVSPYITGTAQTGLVHINIDKATSGTVSPNGFRLSASGGALYHAVQSSNAPVAMLNINRTFSYHDENIFGIGGEVESYLRANVAQPFRFTLGGPLRLSASSMDEYRGTDVYVAHAGYLRRIAALPTGLGQGLYGLLGYEAGEVWSPEQRVFLRQDGTAGLVGDTPLGLITVGVSIGDAGRRKVFFTIGRWF